MGEEPTAISPLRAWLRDSAHCLQYISTADPLSLSHTSTGLNCPPDARFIHPLFTDVGLHKGQLRSLPLDVCVSPGEECLEEIIEPDTLRL